MARVSKGLLLFYVVFTVVLAFILKSSGLLADYSTYFRVSGFSPMNASALTALYVAFLMCRPGKSQIQWSLLLGSLAEALYQVWLLPTEMTLVPRLISMGGGFGLVGLLGIVVLYFRATEPNAKNRCQTCLLTGLCLLFYPLAASKGIGTLSLLSPLVYDSHAYLLEGALGFYPAQEVARFLLENPNFHYFSLAIYSRLPLFIFIGIWWNIRSEGRCYTSVFLSFLLGGALAFPFFFLLPMVGIDLYIGTPPWPLLELPHIAESQLVEAPSSFPRTCLPSLHTTWVMIPFFALRRLSLGHNLFFGAVAILTLISALAPSVGHYALDLFVGVPFSLGVVALAAKKNERNRRARTQCLLFGFGIPLVSVLGLRYFPALLAQYATLSWTLLAVAVIVTFLLESRLAQATLEEPDTPAQIAAD